MRRMVHPERLDALPAAHPDALRSRRDLRRIHRVMGTQGALLLALRAIKARRGGAGPLRMLELGAGDGSLLLGVARGLGTAWAPVELTLLDRLPLVASSTLDGYARLGWTAQVKVGDALEWAAGQRAASGKRAGRHDLVVASLFMHHFEGPALAGLLHAIACSAWGFVAFEPRRDPLALAASRLVGLIGANAVTREDAVTSVRAGFDGLELSALWPSARHDWTLDEHRAGLFGHGFSACRLDR